MEGLSIWYLQIQKLSHNSTMPFKFLHLPSEIRILVYELLLADPSLIVQYLFIRNGFRSMFRNKTPPAISAQIIRTCRQLAREASPFLYGTPRFDCSNCINGIEKLRAQIGPRNFSLIKRLILDSEDLHGVADTLRSGISGGMYHNLECMTTTAHRIVDLSQIGWEFDLHVQELSGLCRSAHQILQSGSPLRVLGQVSHRKSSRSYADAVDASDHRVKWKFARSPADLAPHEHILDVERLLYLASLIQTRSGDAVLAVGRCPSPTPLVHGIQQIIYPEKVMLDDSSRDFRSRSTSYTTNGVMDIIAQHETLET